MLTMPLLIGIHPIHVFDCKAQLKSNMYSQSCLTFFMPCVPDSLQAMCPLQCSGHMSLTFFRPCVPDSLYTMCP